MEESSEESLARYLKENSGADTNGASSSKSERKKDTILDMAIKMLEEKMARDEIGVETDTTIFILGSKSVVGIKNSYIVPIKLTQSVLLGKINSH